MGQKSRAKRQGAPRIAPKKIVSVPGPVERESQALQQPSLVKSSATFQPKIVQFEEALSVRRSDIRKIGILGAVMACLLGALTVFSAASPTLEHLGTRLSHAARL